MQLSGVIGAVSGGPLTVSSNTKVSLKYITCRSTIVVRKLQPLYRKRFNEER